MAIPPSVHRGSAHALLRVRREQATASRSLLGVEEVVASSAPRLQASTPLAEQSWRFLTVGPRTSVTQRRSAVGFPSRTAYGMCSRRQPRWGRLCLDAGPRLPSARPMKPPAEPTSVTLMSPLSLHLRDLLRQAIDQYVRARTTPPATRCCGECGADYSDLPGPVLGSFDLAPTGSGVAANELLLSRDGSQRRGHNRRPDKRNADGVTELNPRAVAGRTFNRYPCQDIRSIRAEKLPVPKEPVHLLVHAQRLTTSVRRLHIWSEIGGEPPELLDLPDDETQATLAGRLSTFASEDVTSLTQTYWNTFFAFIGTGPAIQAAREAEDSEALAAALALERALRQLTGVRGAPTLL